eukprot:1409176-Rhodomonas_salina.7
MPGTDVACGGAPGARDGDYKYAADNAIDSVGKVCKFQSGAVDTAQILPVWVSWLPLQVANSHIRDVANSHMRALGVCAAMPGD